MAARVIAFLSLLLTAGGAALSHAQTNDDARLFFGQDDRAAIGQEEIRQMPWSAIGKLVFSSGGHCSGALVSSRVVLTSAHCFHLGFEGGAPVYDFPESFRAGHNKDQAVAISEIRSFWVAPAYEEDRGRGAGMDNGHDYAFALLEDPIGETTGWFAVRPLSAAEQARTLVRSGLVVNQAGYSGDREDELTAHIGCPLTDFLPHNVIAHRCDIVQGDSGSPLFLERGPVAEIVAVNSAIYFGPRPFNIAVDANAFADDLERYIQRYDPEAGPSGGADPES